VCSGVTSNPSCNKKKKRKKERKKRRMREASKYVV
jgi:hypothetical protein